MASSDGSRVASSTHADYNSIDRSVVIDENNDKSKGSFLDSTSSMTANRGTRHIALVCIAALVVTVGTVYFTSYRSTASTTAARAILLQGGNGLQSITKESNLVTSVLTSTASASDTMISTVAESSTSSNEDSSPLISVQSGVPSSVVSTLGKTKKPSKEESSLSEDDYDTVDKGAEALNSIGNIIDNFAPVSSPADFMNFMGDVSGVIGNFVPYFGLVGAAFTIFGSLISEPGQAPKRDPMLEYLNVQFEIVNNKLDTLLDIPQDIKLQICEQTWDTNVNQYIVAHKTQLQIMADAASDTEFRSALVILETQCKTNPPSALLSIWQRVFVDGGSDFQQCFDLLKSDVGNRLLYFRTHYTIPIVKNLMEAIQYHGICSNLIGKETPQTSSAVARKFTTFKDSFKNTESVMMKSSPDDWAKTLTNKYGDDINADSVYAALKKDFFPGYKYATVDIIGLACTSIGPNSNNLLYGGVCVGEKVFMMFKSPDAFELPTTTLPPWQNTKCPNEPMCAWKVFDNPYVPCVRIHCDQGKNNLKRNNVASFNDYENRGALIATTTKQTWGNVRWVDGTACCDWDMGRCIGPSICGGYWIEGWTWENEPPTKIDRSLWRGDRYIVARSFEEWEDDNDGTRWAFTILSVNAGPGVDPWNNNNAVP